MADNKVSLELENLFSAKADVYVIPRSTEGTLSSDIIKGIQQDLKITPDKLPYRVMGSLDLEVHSGDRQFNLLYATCVEKNTSNYEVIHDLASQIAKFSQNNPSVRSIATPLLGTGAGGLDHTEVYKILNDVFSKSGHNTTRLYIYVREEAIYQRLVNWNRANTKPEKKSEKKSDTITWPENVNYFLAEAFQMGRDFTKRFLAEAIWENFVTTSPVTKPDHPFSIIFLKRTQYRGGSLESRILAVGRIIDSNTAFDKLKVQWITKDLNLVISPDSLVFAQLEQHAARSFLQQIGGSNVTLSGLFDFASFEVELSPVPSRIASIQSDSDAGTDYLGITKDITAFSKTMASKRFTPPLAIALFGKWGHGKSFFMNKLINKIESLHTKNKDVYCKGIAQIRFNAWSYLDANLWASIVTRIFESLNDYINNDDRAKNFKQEIQRDLTEKLAITSENRKIIEQKKVDLQAKIENLETERDKIKDTLNNNTEEIRNSSLKLVIKNANEQFGIKTQIEKALQNNPTWVDSTQKLKSLVPEAYWQNPAILYDQIKSKYTFLKAFFHKKNLGWNIIALAIILAIIFGLPLLLKEIVNEIPSINFLTTPVQSALTFLALLAPILTRIKSTYDKFQPLVASFWKIKEDYDDKIKEAIFEFEQQEKALQLEIKQSQTEIAAIDSQIQQANTIKNELEFKLTHALATEALYTFIERRSKSDDYKKHLGIISTVRNDFDVLSKLFLDHNMETGATEFREKFDTPLERIILYIDDLDRCPEGRVIEVLEAVNLLMAFPLFIVVVGVDPRWVKNALIKRYANQFGHSKQIERVNASDYLEKIFQVPFHLQAADDKSIKSMIRSLAAPSLVDKRNLEEQVPEEITLEHGTTPQEIELASPGATRSTRSPQDDTETNLLLSGDEVGMLEDMSVVIGDNPRAIKRFVNVYQVVRAHESLNYRTYDKQKDFLVIMFLLALSIGKYRKLTEAFAQFITDNENGAKPFSAFFQNPASAKQDEITRLKHSLNVALTDGENYRTLQKEEIASFKKHYKFVNRFTFQDTFS